MEAGGTLSYPCVGGPERYLPEDINIHNSHCLGGARRRSLAAVLGLALPYTPILLEVFHRLCS